MSQRSADGSFRMLTALILPGNGRSCSHMIESNKEILEELADEVRDNPPRMFAIYGVYDHQVLEDDDPGYIEWGFEFPEESRGGRVERGRHAFEPEAGRGPAGLVQLISA